MQFKLDADAAVLIVMGQSNAYGHGTQLDGMDILSSPLKNVFGLSKALNQALGLADVKWSGFVSSSMNLGDGQDNTCCVSNVIAKRWQEMIDTGVQLPDLFIIQISSGGQGIDCVEKDGNNKWYVKREPVVCDAPWPEGNISLYPLAEEILTLAMANLRKAYKNPQIIGLHWNQWETEADTGGHAVENAQKNYIELFDGFKKSIGQPFPLYFYRPLSHIYNNPPAVKALYELFCRFESEWDNTCIIDVTNAPFYNAELDTQGIFQADLVHYSNQTQEWFAQYQLDKILS